MTLESFIPEGCRLTAGPFYEYRDGFVEATIYYRTDDGYGSKRRVDLRFALIARGDVLATEAVPF